ncbi:MAG: thiamine phosphate synthase [Candidatus Acidiferrales bacterium]
MCSSLLNPSATEPPLPSVRDRPIVCYVTDGQESPSTSREHFLSERIRTALTAGADWIQIREKNICSRSLVGLVRQSVRDASTIASASRILVNDRLDVALAADASGVHLGRESFPAEPTVYWCRAGAAPKGFLVGVSCHSLEEVRAAESGGVDYVFFGPIFDTPSKRLFGTPQGTNRLSDVCRFARVPVIAIGGVDETNASDCIRAGAKGIAAIRSFQNRSDAASIQNFVSAIHACG